MGMAPAETSVGDLICVFYGCPVPCVLREKEDDVSCFFFIGSCYLNGMMTADAIEKLTIRHGAEGKANAEVERDFVIL
ncbi:uncharacterized protein K460DRAFT_149709 [Cucurbitaria berberidis CBS 394.84]|uniref:Uncharacterized protein n=1 Tax=Cucurbitaria berberidis CBS 394.84 TaxID=1168544 RepID=A0A9P4GDM7_9PLEO|nr:uncharacterized protein K460DRAFT_149709 [Cucurbitaria berberidis CBS 394.84]KAF1843692.1 hypothetical protein K460DRAFT_149709 [Cucurbitaria berberidis CBS 394.84]